jgi:hypothetical protein
MIIKLYGQDEKKDPVKVETKPKKNLFINPISIIVLIYKVLDS